MSDPIVIVEPKQWWQSKTLWTNFAALITAIGIYLSTKDASAVGMALLAIANFVLRLITKQPVE